MATLRQDPLGGESLEAAIQHLVEDLQNDATGMTPLTITPALQINRPLPANLKVILYRIAQEGLTNIVKHAEASDVHLQIVTSKAIATLTLEDNGKGFQLEQASTGFGLQSMRDRAEAAGGTFSLRSIQCSIQRSDRSDHANRPNSGTRLQVSLPLPPIN